jgi:3-oxoacyl-[acyl-carrier protein] reductase
MAAYGRSVVERGATWGRIISLTSGGPMGFPGEASYGAAKAALDNYTMTASRELADFGVTANVVYPPVTAWLCTDAARMVTGNVIRLR